VSALGQELNKTRIILADEPTATLDKHCARDVVELIQNLAKKDRPSGDKQTVTSVSWT
jgi:ABC-type lipoprotein export system ATPase subunit